MRRPLAFEVSLSSIRRRPALRLVSTRKSLSGLGVLFAVKVRVSSLLLSRTLASVEDSCRRAR